MKLSKIISVFLAVLVIFFTFSLIYAKHHYANATQNKAVENVDLINAGFTGVKIINPDASAFKPPLKYFEVNQTIETEYPEWGKSANIVAILIQEISSADWIYENGEILFSNIAGKTQARWGKDGYYIVVTGPDYEKVANLLNILIQK